MQNANSARTKSAGSATRSGIDSAYSFCISQADCCALSPTDTAKSVGHASVVLVIARIVLSRLV